jgi:sporulation protein YlmC with PRC-barrel domain
MTTNPDGPDPLRIDFHLLDRQIVDPSGAKIGKVDDVEFEVDDQGRIRIAALLVGLHVLGTRMSGPVGRWLAAVATRLHPQGRPEPLRVPFEHVTKVGSEVIIGLRPELFEPPPLEKWLRDKVIGRIPGAHDANE